LAHRDFASRIHVRNALKADKPETTLMTDTVEKGICRNLEATLIQDRKPTRNLDSKIHVAGFVRFKF